MIKILKRVLSPLDKKLTEAAERELSPLNCSGDNGKGEKNCGGEGRKRKERSDKKVEIKPAIPWVIFTWITEECAYQDEAPIKDIGEELCLEALDRRVEDLLPYLKYEYWTRDKKQLHMPVEEKKLNWYYAGRVKRISVRLSKVDHEEIKRLARSCDCSVNKMCALLIQLGAVERDKRYRESDTRTGDGWETYHHPYLQSKALLLR